MNYDLTKQELRVYNYLLVHPGATTREIINATYITCPSGRITEMRKKGVPIISIGHKKYDGARAFEMYAIDVRKPLDHRAHKFSRSPQDHDTCVCGQSAFDAIHSKQEPKPPTSEQAKQLALSMTA
jgi:hypothetical protein